MEWRFMAPSSVSRGVRRGPCIMPLPVGGCNDVTPPLVLVSYCNGTEGIGCRRASSCGWDACEERILGPFLLLGEGYTGRNPSPPSPPPPLTPPRTPSLSFHSYPPPCTLPLTLLFPSSLPPSPFFLAPPPLFLLSPSPLQLIPPPLLSSSPFPLLPLILPPPLPSTPPPEAWWRAASLRPRHALAAEISSRRNCKWECRAGLFREREGGGRTTQKCTSAGQLRGVVLLIFKHYFYLLFLFVNFMGVVGVRRSPFYLFVNF